MQLRGWPAAAVAASAALSSDLANAFVAASGARGVYCGDAARGAASQDVLLADPFALAGSVITTAALRAAAARGEYPRVRAAIAAGHGAAVAPLLAALRASGAAAGAAEEMASLQSLVPAAAWAAAELLEVSTLVVGACVTSGCGRGGAAASASAAGASAASAPAAAGAKTALGFASYFARAARYAESARASVPALAAAPSLAVVPGWRDAATLREGLGVRAINGAGRTCVATLPVYLAHVRGGAGGAAVSGAEKSRLWAAFGSAQRALAVIAVTALEAAAAPAPAPAPPPLPLPLVVLAASNAASVAAHCRAAGSLWRRLAPFGVRLASSAAAPFHPCVANKSPRARTRAFCTLLAAGVLRAMLARRGAAISDAAILAAATAAADEDSAWVAGCWTRRARGGAAAAPAAASAAASATGLRRLRASSEAAKVEQLHANLLARGFAFPAGRGAELHAATWQRLKECAGAGLGDTTSLSRRIFAITGLVPLRLADGAALLCPSIIDPADKTCIPPTLNAFDFADVLRAAGYNIYGAAHAVYGTEVQVVKKDIEGMFRGVSVDRVTSALVWAAVQLFGGEAASKPAYADKSRCMFFTNLAQTGAAPRWGAAAGVPPAAPPAPYVNALGVESTTGVDIASSGGSSAGDSAGSSDSDGDGDDGDDASGGGGGGGAMDVDVAQAPLAAGLAASGGAAMDIDTEPPSPAAAGARRARPARGRARRADGVAREGTATAAEGAAPAAATAAGAAGGGAAMWRLPAAAGTDDDPVVVD